MTKPIVVQVKLKPKLLDLLEHKAEKLDLTVEQYLKHLIYIDIKD